MQLVDNLISLPSKQAPVSPAPNPLVTETHHRVANNLALIAGLVRMQARDVARRPAPASQEDVKVLLNKIAFQIEAVGRLHGRLAQLDGAADIDLTTYLRDFVESAIAALSLDERTHLAFVSNGPCSVPASSAHLVGLALSELLMNAIKYAHPAGVTGKVRIACNKAGDTIIVDVADDGVGFPDGFEPMKGGGLGLRLVRSLTDQLNGQLRFRDTGVGLHVTLSIPTCSNKDFRG